MPTLNKIFVIIDPTTDNQAALTNAAWVASQNQSITLHVYEAVFSSKDNADSEALKRVELARHRAWVDTLVEPIRAAGTGVTVEIDWTSEWRDAIAPAAKRAEADMIVKAASVHSGAGRRLLKTSDWSLLRNSHCPVYLIKRDSVPVGVKMLLALDIKREDELHNTLNERVIEYGRAFIESVPESSLYAVNAYSDSAHYVYPDALAAKIGIDKTAAHCVQGPPEKVIPEVAAQLDASIVVIGTVARDGLKAAMIGNTAEKILDSLNTNILTVVAQ